MKGWYKYAVDHEPPRTWVILDWITAKHFTLNHQMQLSGENIPLSVKPFPVEDLLPTEDDIKWEVWRKSNNSYGGLSGMMEEHLKRWLKESTEVESVEESATKTTKEPEEEGV